MADLITWWSFKPANVLSPRGELIWSFIPYAVCWCIWKVRSSRIFYDERFLLFKLQVKVLSNCCLCKSDAESSGDLFIHCSWVTPILSFFLGCFGVAWFSQPRLGPSFLVGWPNSLVEGVTWVGVCGS